MASLRSLLPLINLLCFWSFANAVSFTTTATITSEEIFHTEGIGTSSSISPAASQTDTQSSSSTQCEGDLVSYCPACDGTVIKWGTFGAFVVQCNAAFEEADYYEDMQNATVGQCIDACVKFEGCYGPLISPDGKCVLAQSQSNDPQIVRRPGWAVLLPRSTGAIIPPSPIGTGYSVYDNSSTPTSKSPASHTPSSIKTADVCQASSISCPDCDGAYVKDALNETYHVLCDNELFSESYYAVQRWLTPAGCMAECDNFTWCGGGVSWPEGNCQLARGEDVFPQRKSGFTAFLQVNLSYTPPPPELSAYPTGDFTSVYYTSAHHNSAHHTSVHHTSARHTPARHTPGGHALPTPLPNHCDSSNIRCPHCDGSTLSDGFNESYRVQCNFQPICKDIAGDQGWISQNACLKHCDMDATCLAAIFQDGRCNLCQGSLEGLLTYDAPGDYVVFIAKPFLEVPKPIASEPLPVWSHNSTHSFRTSASPGSTTHTRSLTTRTSTSILHSFTTLVSHNSTTSSSSQVTRTSTFMVNPSPEFKSDISSVSCPKYDDTAVIDPSDGRHFNVQCDTGFGAAHQRFLSASDFEDCAASCTDECGGIQLASQTRCGLFTSISVVSSEAGATAGVYIMYPKSNTEAAMSTTATEAATTETKTTAASVPAGLGMS